MAHLHAGVYFIKQYPEGNAFFDVWLSWEHTNIGHDQDGLNTVVRASRWSPCVCMCVCASGALPRGGRAPSNSSTLFVPEGRRGGPRFTRPALHHLRQCPAGRAASTAASTLSGQEASALNTLRALTLCCAPCSVQVRGRYFRGDQSLPEANWDTVARVLYAALHNVTQVGLLPIHFFGNAYT